MIFMTSLAIYIQAYSTSFSCLLTSNDSLLTFAIIIQACWPIKGLTSVWSINLFEKDNFNLIPYLLIMNSYLTLIRQTKSISNQELQMFSPSLFRSIKVDFREVSNFILRFLLFRLKTHWYVPIKFAFWSRVFQVNLHDFLKWI